MARSRIPQTKKPNLPIPLTQRQAGYVRLKHPTELGLYYSSKEAMWVHEQCTVWTMEEWRGRFGRGIIMTNGNDWSKTLVDSEGRHWEFFGYTIPLYD